MLPTPVSFATRRPFRRNGGTLHTRQRTIDVLRTRARVTNLAVLLLGSFACLSFIFNLSYYFSSPGGLHPLYPSSILSTIGRDRGLRNVNHLVIVPGHSIWHGTDAQSRLDEQEWVLEPYQKGSGRVETFFQHIARGGQTRASSTMTEAESYLRLALNANLFANAASTPFPRATTENYALDSFQNLLFSITVVGYEMKRARFTDLHRVAIRWPEKAFHYIGIDPRQKQLAPKRLYPYSKDLYGCHSDLLSKRRSRNPFARFHSYFTSSPELTDIFEYCPSESTILFQGPLPWT
ncbi:hypothetical protein BDZ89DRAFT_1072207 [Hymenopellis radicata]|nr:hypothetical protein BDZ89DRAFT_1072207 [Hymenopellis radicata]